MDVLDQKQTIPYLGLASGIGGGHAGSKEGPLLIQHEWPQADWKRMVQTEHQTEDRLNEIASLNQELAQLAFQYLLESPSLIVVGGDHSCGIGTWSGVSESLAREGKEMALLWCDAHMDSHTFETSESGNPHGMPLAALLGYGSKKLTHILSDRAKVKPENLFLIGIRSFEAPEQELLNRLGVRIYYMEEVKQRGVQAILEEILVQLKAKNLPYGMSLDIDFFDPEEMCATGTPEPGGPKVEEFLQSAAALKAYPPKAFEFVEFNPPCDPQGISLPKVKQILAAMEKVLVPISTMQ